jgi:hypothetical protein
MVTGTNYINNNNIIDVLTIINSKDINNKLNVMNSIEYHTIQKSNYIVSNSVLMNNLINKIYKINNSLIIDLHEIYNYIKCDKTDSNQKIYDIIFISSNFDRKVKNIDLVINIFKNEALKDKKIIAIGKNSKEYMPNNVTTFDFLPQDKIMKLMNISKIIIVTSYIESYSISAIEAYNNNCLTLLSKNVALSYFVNKFFVINSYDVNIWINKIKLILNNYNYFTKIYYNKYNKSAPIDYLITGNSITGNSITGNSITGNSITNILLVSIDIPYIGGSATNLYNILKYLQNNKNYNIITIFISNVDIADYNPLNFKNVHKINFDLTTEIELKKLKEYYINNGVMFKYIFCKNYKIFPYFRNIFYESYIIFSPSGLRMISSSTENQYLLDLKLNNIYYSKYNTLSLSNNIYKFINDNDKFLDIYALKNSDIIIPNSLVTYNVINNIYDNLENLNYSINITNINLQNINNNNFNEREYDIIFIAYNWKRNIKNYKLVIDIINKIEIDPKKIIVIGNEQIKYNKNIVSIDYLENNKINDLLKKCKTLIITSYYDSNPNVLIEGVANGCNIVTTKNVGNYENIDNRGLVINYNDISEWIKIITNSLKERYKYNGEFNNDIVIKINKLFDYFQYNKNIIIGIYKIPAYWNEIKNIFKLNNFIYIEKINNELIENIINYDIYFELVYNIGILKKCNSIDYIIIEENLKVNECYYVYKVFPYYENYVKIWRIKSYYDLLNFKKANIYFLRGNYTEYYNNLCPDKSFKIFYPATSLKQFLSPIKEKEYIDYHRMKINIKYDIILKHEDNMWDDIYNSKGKLINFFKYSTDYFVCYNLIRTIDFCFIATENQITKNHNLFINFIEYLENKRINKKIIFIGDISKIDYKNIFLIEYLNELKYVHFEYISRCDKNKLIEIYNLSKVNIIFSGRDAYPRVIAESLSCGCFNIALDTLSDGKDIYNGYFGKLIGDPNINKVLINKSSLCYKNNDTLWDKVLSSVPHIIDHNEISIKFKKTYNVDTFINSL